MKYEYENAVHKIIELAKVIENRKNAMWVNGNLDKQVKGRLLTIGKILNQDVDTGDKNCNLQSVIQRSELLSFMNFLFENWQPRRHLTADMLVDAYLKANCG